MAREENEDKKIWEEKVKAGEVKREERERSGGKRC